MEWLLATTAEARSIRVAGSQREIGSELFRKAIHLTIAIVPFLASIDIYFTMMLLGSGTIVYTYSELMRLHGRPVFLLSQITVMASRSRDHGKMVTGPITLAMGAMLALLLYPSPAATIAIYALAFGDGLSSVVGKVFGDLRIPFTGGKTIEGSATCFLAVFVASYAIAGNAAGAALIASVATALEALPVKDLDNIVLPVGTGFVATQILSSLPL